MGRNIRQLLVIKPKSKKKTIEMDKNLITYCSPSHKSSEHAGSRRVGPLSSAFFIAALFFLIERKEKDT